MEFEVRRVIHHELAHPERNMEALRILRSEIRWRSVADPELDARLIELMLDNGLADEASDERGTVDRGGGRHVDGSGSDPQGAGGHVRDERDNWPTDGGYGG